MDLMTCCWPPPRFRLTSTCWSCSRRFNPDRKLVIATDEQAQDPALLIPLLESSGATIYQATPVRYRMLLDAGWKGMPNLQLLCGGEKLSRELADQLLERCATLWNVYGPTETTVWSSAARIKADGQPITIGQPIANTTLVCSRCAHEAHGCGCSGRVVHRRRRRCQRISQAPATYTRTFCSEPVWRRAHLQNR